MIRQRWRRIEQFDSWGSPGGYRVDEPATVRARRRTGVPQVLSTDPDAKPRHHSHEEAWEAYRYTPEIGAAIRYKANAASRVRLFIARVPLDGSDPEPVEDTPENADVLAPIRELFGGPVGQGKILRQWMIHRSVVAECVIVSVRLSDEEMRAHRVSNRTQWSVMAYDSIVGASSPSTLRIPVGTGIVTRQVTSVKELDGAYTVNLPPGVGVIVSRIADPVNWEDSDSAMRALIPTAHTLNAINDRVHSDAVSRQKIVVFDSRVTVPNIADLDEYEAQHGDALLHTLVEKTARDIKNPRSARANAPLFARFEPDGEGVSIGDTFGEIDLSTSYADRSNTAHDMQTRRVGVGMDTPVEVVSGVGDSNHWNATLVGMDGTRIHLGPHLTEFSEEITTQWLRQWYASNAPRVDGSLYMMWWDGSAITQDPDKLAAVLEVERTRPGTFTRDEIRVAANYSPKPDIEDDPGQLPNTTRSPSTGGQQQGIPRVQGIRSADGSGSRPSVQPARPRTPVNGRT